MPQQLAQHESVKPQLQNKSPTQEQQKKTLQSRSVKELPHTARRKNGRPGRIKIYTQATRHLLRQQMT